MGLALGIVLECDMIVAAAGTKFQVTETSPKSASPAPSRTAEPALRSRPMTSATLPASAGEPRDLVFISYSRPDRDWLEHLLIFLKPYTRRNLKIWADPYIQVGDEWRR